MTEVKRILEDTLVRKLAELKACQDEIDFLKRCLAVDTKPRETMDEALKRLDKLGVQRPWEQGT